MIAKSDPSLNVSDIISIFEWKRGDESLLEFTHQLSHYELFFNSAEFWERATGTFLNLKKPSQSMIIVNLPQSFELAVGRDKYRFLNFSSEYTTEETLINEYEHGYGGQISVGAILIDF
jgi:hypothetical protein